ncbi:unnamed protein product [Larinioides sclopetarius]|uniref:Uncharacterized protein n=1 Tax=Larinioides sclopetarius TaxID=280406 RepID=A0AAV2AQG3_9ARAC
MEDRRSTSSPDRRSKRSSLASSRILDADIPPSRTNQSPKVQLIKRSVCPPQTQFAAYRKSIANETDPPFFFFFPPGEIFVFPQQVVVGAEGFALFWIVPELYR